jgi:hypothetical protein
MTIEIPKSSGNYIDKTSKNYEIEPPDSDGDLVLSFDAPYEGDCYLYFSKADLILMLSRFNP